MPVINQVDPFSAATEAVGSYFDNKRSKDLQDQAAAHQKAREGRQDMESDRSYAIQQGEAADQHLRTQSELATEDQNRKIAAATEEYNEKFRPIQLQLGALQVKQAQGEILSQQDQHQLNVLQKRAAAVDLDIKQRFGVPAAKAALQASQAQASTAETEAKFAPQQAAANLAQTRASTASTQASTALTQRETALAGTGGGGYGGGGGGGGRGRGRGGASERQAAEYDDAMGALSDTGRQFYNMLYSTNNPPTRAQAMLALQASMRGKSGLTPNDAKNLQTLIDSRESQFVSPSEQAGQTRYDQRTATSNERYSAREDESEFKDVARGRTFNALAPRLRDKVRSAMVGGGMNVQQTMDALDASNLPDEDKQAIHRALAGS